MKYLTNLKNYKYRWVRMNEELTKKTIKTSDKVKIARVIADMLGVEKAETMSPDSAVNMGLRKIRNKRMTPELTNVLQKMIKMAIQTGINVDTNLLPKNIKEDMDTADYKVNPYTGRKYRAHRVTFPASGPKGQPNTGIKGKYHNDDKEQVEEVKKFSPKKTYNELMKSVKSYEIDVDDVQAGESLTKPEEGEEVRREKILYKTEEKQHDGISDDEIEKLADIVDDEDDILDLYDEDELSIIDDESGDVVEKDDDEEEDDLKEQVLNEVMTRVQRLKARVRFLRTKGKRERKLKIALSRKSDIKTLQRRARKLAIKMIKQKIMKKPLSQFTVSDKERAEKILQRKKTLIARLSLRLVPKIRKIENERLSHKKHTKEATKNE